MTQIEQQRERAARNQSLFREVNEQIEVLSRTPGPRSTSSFIDFVCECTIDGCTERVPLTIEEYEAVRGGPNHFFVLSGHEIDGIEETIDSTDRYLVVAKLGRGGDLAEKLDPRGA
jgi:hypothetical protein